MITKELIEKIEVYNELLDFETIAIKNNMIYIKDLRDDSLNEYTLKDYSNTIYNYYTTDFVDNIDPKDYHSLIDYHLHMSELIDAIMESGL